MKFKTLAFAAMALSIPLSAQAEEPKTAAPAQAGMDMSKMGPWARKPKNEKAVKKEITDFLKAEEELAKKADFAGAIANIDFPILMITDDAAGVVKAEPWTQEKYTAEMKPFWDNMPKDMKYTHKATITVLSDSLANVTDDFTTTMGKQKLSGRNMGMLVKRDGKWKWKAMGEAGWGGAPSPEQATK